MNIIMRILFFIPVVFINLVWLSKTFILLMFDFCRYGGEMITYHNKRNKKTIQDVFDKLNENLNK